MQRLKFLLRDFDVLPLLLGQLGCVFAPTHGSNVLSENIYVFLTLGFEKPIGSRLVHGNEIRLVISEVHGRTSVFNGETEGARKLISFVA